MVLAIALVGLSNLNAQNQIVEGDSLESGQLTTQFASSPFDQVTTSISEIGTIDVLVYPNPTADVINIVSDVMVNNVKVINAVGKTVININSDVNTVNLSDLNNGMYFIVVNDEKTLKVLKR